MGKISFNLFKQSFGFKCEKCGSLIYEKREICESCGEKGFIRESTKKDYKEYIKK